MRQKRDAVTGGCFQDASAKSRVGAISCCRSRGPRSLAGAVTARLQTPEEERQFNAAFDVFLSELIRQEIDRQMRREDT
jgi:hypothetical protein